MEKEPKYETITVKDKYYEDMLCIALKYFNIEKVSGFKKGNEKYYVIHYSTPKPELYDIKTLKKSI